MNLQGFTRVTEVLYQFSGLQHVDKNVLSHAAERGTRVHNICESIVRGAETYEADDEAKGYVESFLLWWNQGHKVLSIEERFFCHTLMLTGQVDMIIEAPNGAIILDLKTSQSPSKTWPLQGSAYAYMARQKGYPIVGIHFLQLKKDGSQPTLHIYSDQFEVFKMCLEVYNYFKGVK